MDLDAAEAWIEDNSAVGKSLILDSAFHLVRKCTGSELNTKRREALMRIMMAEKRQHTLETEESMRMDCDRDLFVFASMLRPPPKWEACNSCRLCESAVQMYPCAKGKASYKCYACMATVCGDCSAVHFVPNMCTGCVRKRPGHIHAFCDFNQQRVCEPCWACCFYWVQAATAD